MADLINWKKIDIGGWFRHEGSTDRFGPYTVEKEDAKIYSVWWGIVDIGESDNVTSAKRIAQCHANAMAFNAHNQKEPKT